MYIQYTYAHKPETKMNLFYDMVYQFKYGPIRNFILILYILRIDFVVLKFLSVEAYQSNASCLQIICLVSVLTKYFM